MISNLTITVKDLEDSGFTISTLTPDSVLVNDDTGAVKIVISKSTIQRHDTLGGSGYMQLSTDQIRYVAPEILNN
jgi:hypothetical protein